MLWPNQDVAENNHLFDCRNSAIAGRCHTRGVALACLQAAALAQLEQSALLLPMHDVCRQMPKPPSCQTRNFDFPILQDTGQLWQRLVAHEVRRGHREGTRPRYRERQHKVAGDRIAWDHVLARFLHGGTITQTKRFGSVARLLCTTPQPTKTLNSRHALPYLWHPSFVKIHLLQVARREKRLPPPQCGGRRRPRPAWTGGRMACP